MTKCKVIALANQKGGTAKTTTTLNLGIGLAHQGRKVLLVDADPQGDLTTALGWTDADNFPITLDTQMKKILQDEPFVYNEGILHHEEGVDIIPTNIELSGMEISLVNAMSREQTLKLYLTDLKKDYDYILIDCMPSLGMLTINALAAADSVIVPVQAHYLPLKGISRQKKRRNALPKRESTPSVKRSARYAASPSGRPTVRRYCAPRNARQSTAGRNSLPTITVSNPSRKPEKQYNSRRTTQWKNSSQTKGRACAMSLSGITT